VLSLAQVRKLKLGIAGLGRAFALMIPALSRDPRVQVVAAADPRAEARAQFAKEFRGSVFANLDSLLHGSEVDAVYVASPHQYHAEHACLAAAHGKHVLVEKPMALSLEECAAMIKAAREANVFLVVGHSHSFDAPMRRAREIIESGALGALRMLSAWNFTDFLYRPRRPEELDTALGGGAVFNQAAHHIDILRLLAGSPVASVRASTGIWDKARATEGAYSALIQFRDGVFATVAYSGYGHFDSDEFCGWIGEMGQRKDAREFSKRGLENELASKRARNYGGPEFAPQPDQPLHQHFGPLIASCEKGDLRPLPIGVMVYGDGGRRLEPLEPPAIARMEVIDELYGAVVDGRPPLHCGEWGAATLEVCLAMLRSARERREIALPL
jgi:phthalate 4,5-cis-dihydrodiol dehydrogenase